MLCRELDAKMAQARTKDLHHLGSSRRAWGVGGPGVWMCVPLLASARVDATQPGPVKVWCEAPVGARCVRVGLGGSTALALCSYIMAERC